MKTTRNFFFRQNDFIFKFENVINDHVYQTCRLCIFSSTIQQILEIVHNDNHSKFARCYEKIFSIYYIRDLSRYLRNFLKYCSKCQIYQTRRHKFYDFLQSILISSIFFRTITIDFVLTLLKSFSKNFDSFMSINCKYSKRIFLILEKIIWFAIQ